MLFAFTHTFNGTATVLPILDTSGMESSTKTTFTYIWHIIGVENLILGIALLIMAFSRDLSKVKFTAWLIIAILTLRWITIAAVMIISEGSSIKQIIPDTIAMFLLIVLLLLGIRVRSTDGQQ